MTSPVRARANRLNAKRSTGPRTAKGKARVAVNALKHGLSVPILLTPGAEARVEEMARAIAGADLEPQRLELACRVAEAQLDIFRIREARRRLLEDPKARQKTLSNSRATALLRRLMREAERMPEGAPDETQRLAAIDQMQRLFVWGDAREGDPPNLVEGLDVLAPQLLRLERYERRATSRRKTAMRAYDAHCRSREMSDRAAPSQLRRDVDARPGKGQGDP